MTKKILVLLALMTSACATHKFDIYGMPKPPKDGSQEYQAGWKAGCETGMTTHSSDYLRTMYKVNVDGNMMANPHYNKGWELGQSYCQYYTSSYLASRELPGGDPRQNNTWFSMKTDGLFSYKGIEKLDYMPFASNEY